MIVDGVEYKDTPDLYELIFKRILNDIINIEDNKQTYKSIRQRMLIVVTMLIMDNKYKYVIALLVSIYRTGSKRSIDVAKAPCAMTLNTTIRLITFIRTILVSLWTVSNCLMPRAKRATTLTIMRSY